MLYTHMHESCIHVVVRVLYSSALIILFLQILMLGELFVGHDIVYADIVLLS